MCYTTQTGATVGSNEKHSLGIGGPNATKFEPLDLLDNQGQAASLGDVGEIRGVTGDGDIASRRRTNHDGSVNDVGNLRQRADGTC